MSIDTVDKEQTENKQKTKKPKMYAVIFINDNYTTMDFVIYLLQKVFNKNEESAVQIMLEIHTKGKSQVGVYSLQIAEQKTYESKKLAKENNYPLQVIMQELD